MEGNGKRDRLEALRDSLSHHSPTVEQSHRIEQLRRAQKEYAKTFMDLTRQGREQAIAITDFELHSMWAVKSIVLEKAESQRT